MVRVTMSLVRFTITQVLSAARFAAPPAMRLFLFATVTSFKLFILAVLSMVKGIDKVSEALADDWTKRAIDAGFPYLWETQLWNFFYVLAFCTILAGWVVTAFTVTFILRLVF